MIVRLAPVLLVVTLDLQVEDAALASRQHHVGHDALAVHQLTVLARLYVTGESRGTTDKLGRCAGVQAEFVDDSDLCFDHWPGRCLLLLQFTVPDMNLWVA